MLDRPLADPWREPSRGPAPARPTGARPVVALAVAVLPYVGAVALHGPDQRRAAVGLLIAGVAIVAAFRPAVPTGVRGSAVLLAAVLAAGLIRPTLGSTVVVLCGASLALALAPTAPGLPRPPAGLRLLALGLVAVTWWREGSPAIAVVGLGLGFAALLLEHRRPSIASAADRQVGRATRWLGATASHVVLAAIALPFLYLPTLLAAPVRRWRASRQDQRGSTWVDRRVGSTDAAKDARRQFVPVPAAESRRLNLVGLAAVLVVSAVVWWNLPTSSAPEAGGARTVVVPTTPSAAPGQASDGTEPTLAGDLLRLEDRASMADAPWAAQLESELQSFAKGIGSELPYGNLAADFAGDLVNVRSGVRRSAAASCSCPTVRVWLVGGSAAFGWHQRDDHTLASAIVETERALGLAVEMSNIAVPGWTLADERQAVERLLDDGAAGRPDLVIFYDGFNDLVGAVVEAAMTEELDAGAPNTLDPSMLAAYSTNGGSLSASGGVAGVTRTAADRYRSEADSARRDLAARGIESVFVLQADAVASPDQLEALEPVIGLTREELLATDLARALDAFEEELEGFVIDARQVMDGLADPVFTDFPHTNEAGADRSAEAVVDGVHDQLLELAD